MKCSLLNGQRKYSIRLVFLLFLFAELVVAGNAAGKKNEDFAADKIPASILTNANAVLREYHEDIQIISINEVYLTERYAVTILNEKGNDYAAILAGYDKLSSIEYIYGWLYDKDGKELGKIDQKAIRDVSSFGTSFFDDNRYKSFDLHNKTYPFTCLYEVKRKCLYSFSLPGWMPQKNYDCAVEAADLEVEYPKDFGLRYRTFHVGTQPSVVRDGETTKLTLSIADLPASDKPDYFTPHENYDYPALILAADKFGLMDLTGDMSTWQNMGKFAYDLNANRDSLPDETKKIVHRLTDTCHSRSLKIELLYDYLKKNSRYFNIKLGIGGWQTLDARFVAEKGYGDCKALSNFMKALLKEAGIVSYQALAYAGAGENGSMQPDFPYNAFNHVILCVPQQNDTTWLECTSRDLPTGYLSSFTDNRYVLLLTPGGGYPVKTPHVNTADNLLVRKAQITVNSADQLTGNITCAYGGIFWEEEHLNVLDQPK